MSSDPFNRVLMTVAVIWGIAGCISLVIDAVVGWWKR